MVVDAINANPPDVAEQALKLNPDTRIVPSLVSALGVIVFAELCVVCLFISKIFAGQDEGLPKPRPSWPQKNSPTRTG